MAEETLHRHENADRMIDPRSGFCNSTSIFHSKQKPISPPPLDFISFISESHRRSAAVAFIDASTGRSITYAELWRAVDSVATCLSTDMGIGKGDVVLILSPNSIFFPVVCLAVISAGAVITTANPLSTAGELSRQIHDSEAALVFTTSELLPKLPSSSPVVLMYSNHQRRDLRTEPLTTLEEMMRTEPGRNRVSERVMRDDPAAILYSSGTTGTSKGVVSTNGILTALVSTVGPRFRMEEQNQIYMASIPMFHSFGFSTFVLTLVSRGCTAVVMPQFGMDQMLSAVEKFGVTYIPLVPPIMVAMVNDAERINREYNLKSLRYVLCGGAPLSEAVKEAFAGKYTMVDVLVGYALTESNGAGASMASVEECRRRRPGAVGILTASTEAMIVDPTSGAALPVNCSGELWLRSAATMKGYLKNKEATKCTLSSDGWLKTGDVCYIDDEGFLFVVDRLKELIKYNGYQVAPAELEGLLLTHPEIVDAAVIPFPDDKVGQYPYAFVVRKKGGSVTETDIINFIAKQVAPYKKVRRVAFVASVPKNPSGKILRKDLIIRATSKI